MAKYIIFVLLLSLAFVANAQNAKILNKDFDVEAYSTISFDLYGETIYESWEADYVLVETTAKLWDTPKRLFDDYLLKGRYYCHLKADGGSANITSIPVKRDKLSARESVVSIVYYPSTFVLNGSQMIRQDDSVTSKDEKE